MRLQGEVNNTFAKTEIKDFWSLRLNPICGFIDDGEHNEYDLVRRQSGGLICL